MYYRLYIYGHSITTILYIILNVYILHILYGHLQTYYCLMLLHDGRRKCAPASSIVIEQHKIGTAIIGTFCMLIIKTSHLYLSSWCLCSGNEMQARHFFCNTYIVLLCHKTQLNSLVHIAVIQMYFGPSELFHAHVVMLNLR